MAAAMLDETRDGAIPPVKRPVEPAVPCSRSSGARDIRGKERPSTKGCRCIFALHSVEQFAGELLRAVPPSGLPAPTAGEEQTGYASRSLPGGVPLPSASIAPHSSGLTSRTRWEKSHR